MADNPSHPNQTNTDAGQIMLKLGGYKNQEWASNTSNFGFKMLSKMGWVVGKGVGKSLQGQATHVKVKKRMDHSGVGCNALLDEGKGWSETAENFSQMLQTLNESYASENSTKSKKKSKKKKKEKDAKVKSESRKLKSSRRLLYMKRIREKNVKLYSTADMSGILGVATKSQ